MKCCSSHTDSQGDSDLCGRQTPACIARWGATISATNHIGHTENQYRPQPYRPKPYRPRNTRRVYLASSCRYFSVSCRPRPYREFQRETAHQTDRPERSLQAYVSRYREDECQIFLSPPIFYQATGIYYLLIRVIPFRVQPNTILCNLIIDRF